MTGNILVDIDKENYILSGDIRCILDSRRAFKYLKDYLQPEIFGDERIGIPFNELNKEEVLTRIRGLLKKFNLNEIKSDNIKNLLDLYYEEEENFNKFSSKALSIRNNNCDVDEFKKFTNILKSNLPARRLYGLQLLSAFHLAFSQNACNFSVPGAGKTSIVYGAYAYLKSLEIDDSKYVDKILIIGPLSSFGPWENEYYECFGRKAAVKRLTGSISKNEKIQYLYSQNTEEITLMSYQGVANISEDITYFLKKNRVLLVLDEAHKIKNTSGGITANSVLSLSKYGRARVVLTGTPAPNGYEDLYNLYKFIWPSKNIIKFQLNQLRDMSENPYDDRIKRLIENISPFFIRIKKSDLGIPKPINNPPIKIKMGVQQRYLYDFIEKKYMDYLISNGSEENLKSVFNKARVIRLMQVATNPALLKKPLDEYFSEQGMSHSIYIDDMEIIKKINTYNEIEIPEKFKKTAEITKSIIEKGEKVIIWATFVQTIKDLSSYLKDVGIENKLLYGGVPVESEENYKEVETREKIINEFHASNSSFNVIIANPFAVAESISLHKVCHNAIYVERNFNVAQFIQSKDRIHRFGLKENDTINYYYLLSENSIDETIDTRLVYKESRMNNIIESQPIPLFDNLNEDLGNEDIKELINNYVKRVK